MERMNSSEQEPTTSNLERLVLGVGLKSNERLDALRNRILEAVKQENWEIVTQLTGEYREGYEAQANLLQDELYQRAQVGVMAVMALLWQDAGLEEYELSELEDALTYTDNMGFDDLGDMIDAELNQK